MLLLIEQQQIEVMKMKEQNQEITDALRTIEKAMSQLRRAKQTLSQYVGEAVGEPPEWLRNRLKVWKKIYQEGKIVTRTKFHQILKSAGYSDPRMAGGFFQGRYCSLVYVAGDKVALTEVAIDSLKEYGMIKEEE